MIYVEKWWLNLPSLDHDDQTVTPPLMATNKHAHSWVVIENDVHCLIVITSEISIDDGYGISSPWLDGDWNDLGHHHPKMFDHFLSPSNENNILVTIQWCSSNLSTTTKVGCNLLA